MRKIVGLVFGAFLLTAGSAYAQTHYCDTVQPTSGTAIAGATATVSACSDNKDTNGNPTVLTGAKLYDNGTASSVTLTPGTTSTVSGKQVYTATITVPATASVHTYQLTFVNMVNGVATESSKSSSFALTVNLPPSAATAPTGLTVK